MKVKGIFLMIGGRVRELRKSLGGISQAVLAKRLGITPSAVASWEQGVREPDNLNCLRLSELATGELAEFFAARAGTKLATDTKAIYYSDPAIANLQKSVTDGFERMEKTLSAILEHLKSHGTPDLPSHGKRSVKPKPLR